MKVTFFLNNIEPQEQELISNIIKSKKGSFDDNFEEFNCIFLYPPTKFSEEKEPKTNDIIESLRQAYEHSLDKSDTYGIFCNSASWILDANKLRKLLESKEVQSVCFSLRVGRVNGVALKMGPRLPYIDDNFIILNIQKCKEQGVFSREVLFTSHFGKWGKAQAWFFSFLEACVPYGYIYIYSDGSDCRNIYGESLDFFSTNYLYSDKFGFLSVKLNNDRILHIARAALLKKFEIGDAPYIKEYVNKYSISDSGLCIKEGIPYLKKRIGPRALDLLMVFKKSISIKVNKANFEYRKKYG